MYILCTIRKINVIMMWLSGKEIPFEGGKDEEMRENKPLWHPTSCLGRVAGEGEGVLYTGPWCRGQLIRGASGQGSRRWMCSVGLKQSLKQHHVTDGLTQWTDSKRVFCIHDYTFQAIYHCLFHGELREFFVSRSRYNPFPWLRMTALSG